MAEYPTWFSVIDDGVISMIVEYDQVLSSIIYEASSSSIEHKCPVSLNRVQSSSRTGTVVAQGSNVHIESERVNEPSLYTGHAYIPLYIIRASVITPCVRDRSIKSKNECIG
jgi:hypothetical protein